MRAIDVIARKRDGETLSAEEIGFFVRGYLEGDIPDYQVSAWLMAILLRGMDRQETIDLTMAIVRSGERLDLSDIAPFVADKHSTGGVGDKTTLTVAPLVAAAGLKVGKMSGRGLGFTGGTLDKLESLPGYQTDLTIEQFRKQLATTGIVVTGQSAELAPADGKLYALRDVTATVPSLPLIASSVMGKKIAAGANGIVLDVKVGHGAFMRTEDQAIELANLMVNIGRHMGRRVRAVISDMNQPLGQAVGNALELREALETLRGRGPADFRRHCLTIAGQLLLVAGQAQDEEHAVETLGYILDCGKAMESFRAWIAAQGGDLDYVDNPDGLPTAALIEEVTAPAAGYVAALNAAEVGLTAMLLGGGRSKKGDAIDHSVGIMLAAKIGDRIEKGQPLFTIHANDSAKLAGARQRMLAAFEWSDEPVVPPPLIHRVIS